MKIITVRSVVATLTLALHSVAIGADVVSIWGGARGTIVLKSDGTVWMWGANDQGQCGDGTTNDGWRPTPVVGLGARVDRPLKGLRSGGSLALSWDTAAGEYFSIEYSTNLAAGFTSVLQSNLLSTPPANSVIVTNDPGYYRLKF